MFDEFDNINLSSIFATLKLLSESCGETTSIDNLYKKTPKIRYKLVTPLPSKHEVILKEEFKNDILDSTVKLKNVDVTFHKNEDNTEIIMLDINFDF